MMVLNQLCLNKKKKITKNKFELFLNFILFLKKKFKKVQDINSADYLFDILRRQRFISNVLRFLQLLLSSVVFLKDFSKFSFNFNLLFILFFGD